jgi:hypothetical protein
MRVSESSWGKVLGSCMQNMTSSDHTNRKRQDSALHELVRGNLPFEMAGVTFKAGRR